MAILDPITTVRFCCPSCRAALCLADHELYFMMGKVILCPACGSGISLEGFFLKEELVVDAKMFYLNFSNFTIVN